MSSARVHSAQSSAPPSARKVAAPDMSHRPPSEQAVIQALQAVAKYPESRDFVETISRRLPGLQTLIDTPTQLEGCLTPTREPVPSTSAATRALSPVSDEELGRKRASPHELSGTAGANDSPKSRPLLTEDMVFYGLWLFRNLLKWVPRNARDANVNERGP